MGAPAGHQAGRRQSGSGAAQGDAEDRKKLRAADKERLRQMDVEADIDQRLMEAEEMATMGLTCAILLFLTRSKLTNS